MLCLDCEKIGIVATRCMVCQSQQVVPLAKWIPTVGVDVIAARREALFAECRGLAMRMNKMMEGVA
jgi:hypothetical protein